MLKISKLTDYGIMLLALMAKRPERSIFTARDLASESGLPLPTVGKLLKTLSHGDFLFSERGVNGGYGLAKTPESISVARVVELLDGPLAITACSATQESCGLETHCPSKKSWQKINQVVYQALSKLTLADMTSSTSTGGGK